MKKADIQKQLVIARVLIGVQQQGLADLLNKEPLSTPVTWNTISKLENGWKKTVKQDLADALCKHLKISISELTKGGIRVTK